MLRLSSTFFLLAGLAAASACGHESEEDPADAQNACAIGSSLLAQILNELERDAPNCRSAADCTSMGAEIECLGNKVGTCGAIVHGASAARFDQAEANARFCASIKPSKYACAVQPSCIATEPACEAGRCVARRLGF
jgi:hypothetical protein